ncbi:10789_t:CDS:2, partial [Acaulospora colombiana]
KEIDLLPYKSAEINNEFYPFLLVGPNLGIPLEFVHEIFKTAHGIFMKVRQNHVQKSSEVISNGDSIELLQKSTRCLMLLNPDFYSATNTRHWIIAQVPLDNLASKLLLDEELENMKTWIETNVSDHSGFHHRQRKDLLGMVTTKRTKTTGIDESLAVLWIEEIQITRDLIMRYPGHETLWNHLRFLSFAWRWLNIIDYIHHPEDSDVRSGENEQINAWPEDQNEFEFARGCIQQVDSLQPDDEKPEIFDNLVKQKRYASSYELWISELVSKIKKNLKPFKD